MDHYFVGKNILRIKKCETYSFTAILKKLSKLRNLRFQYVKKTDMLQLKKSKQVNDKAKGSKKTLTAAGHNV